MAVSPDFWPLLWSLPDFGEKILRHKIDVSRHNPCPLDLPPDPQKNKPNQTKNSGGTGAAKFSFHLLSLFGVRATSALSASLPPSLRSILCRNPRQREGSRAFREERPACSMERSPGREERSGGAGLSIRVPPLRSF